MVAGRPSPAPLGPVYPAGSALGGGWGLLWPYRTRVVRWGLHAVRYVLIVRRFELGGGLFTGLSGRVAARLASHASIPRLSQLTLEENRNPQKQAADGMDHGRR